MEKEELEQYRIDNPDGISKGFDPESKKAYYNDIPQTIAEVSSLDTEETLSFDENERVEKEATKEKPLRRATTMKTTGVKAVFGVAVATSSAVVVGVVYAFVALILNVTAVLITPNSITFSVDARNIGDKLLVAELSGEEYDEFFDVTESGYLTFDGLRENSQYTLKIFDSPSREIFYSKSFVTPSSFSYQAKITELYAWEGQVFVAAVVEELRPDEFYTLSLTDERGKVFYSQDGTEREVALYAALGNVKTVGATVKINGKVVAFESLTVEDASRLDLDGAYWTWKGENAYLTLPALEGDPKLIDGIVTLAYSQEPTCEESGKKSYKAEATFNGLGYYDEKEYSSAALGHDYQATFEWTASLEGSGYTANVSLVCTHNSEHVHNDSALVTVSRTSPECDRDGETIYIASLTYDEVEYEDEKVETITALGHNFSLSYEVLGGDDGEYAVGALECSRCGLIVPDLAASMDLSSTTATCEEGGTNTYDVSVTYDGRNYEDTYEKDVGALGHLVDETLFNEEVAAFAIDDYETGDNNYSLSYVCTRCQKDIDGDYDYDLSFLDDHAEFRLYGGGRESLIDVPYSDNVLTYALSGDSFKITGLDEKADVSDYSSLVLPNQLFGKYVTTIGENAFSDSQYLSMVISERITAIERAAFKGNGILQDVTFMGDVTEIPDEAFSGCTSFEWFETSSEITSVGENAFANCSSLESASLSSIVSLGKGAYAGTDSLLEVFVCFDDVKDASEKTLLGYYFSNESDEDSIAVVQKYSSSSEDYTFYLPSSIKTVIVTNGSILYGALSNMPIEEVWIDDGVNYVDCSAFTNCSYLTSVSISGSWDVTDADGNVIKSYSAAELGDGEEVATLIKADLLSGYVWVKQTA